jgi:hypothetical protein
LDQPGILYQHSKRPEWGYCTIVEIQEDRTRFTFDDGLDRTIRHDHIGLMMHVELDEAHANEIRQRIAKYLARPAVRAAAKPGAKNAKKAAAKKAKVEQAEDADDAG